MKTKKIDYSKLKIKKGSIIKRKIWYTLFLYHMGIYLGDDTVIDFDKKRRGTKSSVKKISLKEFGRGKKISVHAEPKNSKHAEEILEIANILLKHDELPGRYLLFNNCEDFVVKIYGRRYVPLAQRNYVIILILLVLNAGFLPAIIILTILIKLFKFFKNRRRVT
ncbi:lecithin retinol acyltransferase family protein [bacterium]|nr:lecithin retinol acyltransferase family protein [bacterium]